MKSFVLVISLLLAVRKRGGVGDGCGRRQNDSPGATKDGAHQYSASIDGFPMRSARFRFAAGACCARQLTLNRYLRL